MISSVRSSSTSFLRLAFIAAIATLIVLLLPTNLHASVIDYNLTLTPYAGSIYGGTGTLEIASAPVSSGVSNYTIADGGLLGLTFSIDDQNFTLGGGTGTTLVQFVNGSLWDITFAETLGSSPDRFTLDTTGNYAFYYNNGQSASYGTFSAGPSDSPVPEPSALVLLATGLLGGATTIRRRVLAR
jgi:hypothetical protein